MERGRPYVVTGVLGIKLQDARFLHGRTHVFCVFHYGRARINSRIANKQSYDDNGSTEGYGSPSLSPPSFLNGQGQDLTLVWDEGITILTQSFVKEVQIHVINQEGREEREELIGTETIDISSLTEFKTYDMTIKCGQSKRGLVSFQLRYFPILTPSERTQALKLTQHTAAEQIKKDKLGFYPVELLRSGKYHLHPGASINESSPTKVGSLAFRGTSFISTHLGIKTAPSSPNTHRDYSHHTIHNSTSTTNTNCDINSRPGFRQKISATVSRRKDKKDSVHMENNSNYKTIVREESAATNEESHHDTDIDVIVEFPKKQWHKFTSLRQFKPFIKKGLPMAHRAEVWLHTSLAKQKQRENEGMYWRLLTLHKDDKSASVTQIEKDLDRTFPGHYVFSHPEGLAPLKRVLIAYSWYNSGIGYCQAMNFITALLLLFLDEESTFWLLSCIAEEFLPDYFTKIMVGCKADCAILAELISKKMPLVAQHFTRLDIKTPVLTHEWLLSLFIDQLPIDVCLRVLDLFFFERSVSVLLRISVAIFKMFEKDLLAAKSWDDLWPLIKSLPKNVTDADLLLRIAYVDLGSFKEQKLIMKRNKAIFDIQNKDDASELRALTRTLGRKLDLKQFELFSRIITSKYLLLKGVNNNMNNGANSEPLMPQDFTEEDEELSAPSPVAREYTTTCDSLLSLDDNTGSSSYTTTTTTVVVQNYPRLEKNEVIEAMNKSLRTSTLLYNCESSSSSSSTVNGNDSSYGLDDYSAEILIMVKGIQSPILSPAVMACLKYWDIIFCAAVITQGSRLRKIQICWENFDQDKSGRLNFNQIKTLLCYFLKWVERMSEVIVWSDNVKIKSDHLENLKKVKTFVEIKGGKISFVEFRFKILPGFPNLEEWIKGGTKSVEGEKLNGGFVAVREEGRKKSAKELLEEEKKEKEMEERIEKKEEKKKGWNVVMERKGRPTGIGSGEFRLGGSRERGRDKDMDDDWVVIPNRQGED
eukprot:TRINITY_DN520_c0_g1_i1.p1 TRINITY_DN520_c0_g1~~TRINITY_DN520_c0_g1_i1.p1  ORF type:complete len:986 (-),score=239.91 TRINITY_DN520_c0_g1_i1:33-2990(-)